MADKNETNEEVPLSPVKRFEALRDRVQILASGIITDSDHTDKLIENQPLSVEADGRKVFIKLGYIAGNGAFSHSIIDEIYAFSWLEDRPEEITTNFITYLGIEYGELSIVEGNLTAVETAFLLYEKAQANEQPM